MSDAIFDQARVLGARGEPYALAIVVRSAPPISGKAGDKAIVRADGTLAGWIGGGCTQPVVLREARKALEDGKPRLVRITPDAASVVEEGVVAYAMTCHSGGALDVYIEPVLPRPHVVVLGRSRVAHTLVRLARVLDYAVTVAAPDAVPGAFPEADRVLPAFGLDGLAPAGRTYVVVSTQGEDDEAALREALRHDVPYVAFVASRRKAEKVFETLTAGGVPAGRLEQVRVPAGLDIGARTPEEIAVSILAEIVRVMRSTPPAAAPAPPAPADGMRVETLAVEEMTCQHCVHTVEKTLGKIEGVVVLGVEIGSAEVAYDPARVDRRTIVDALARRGYPVVQKEDGPLASLAR